MTMFSVWKSSSRNLFRVHTLAAYPFAKAVVESIFFLNIHMRRLYATVKCLHFQHLVCALFSAFRRARHIILHSCHSSRPHALLACMRAHTRQNTASKRVAIFSLPQILSPGGDYPSSSSILFAAAPREIAPPLCCVFCNANSAGSYVTQRLAAAKEVGAPDF